jgi:hypothetical protein
MEPPLTLTSLVKFAAADGLPRCAFDLADIGRGDRAAAVYISNQHLERDEDITSIRTGTDIRQRDPDRLHVSHRSEVHRHDSPAYAPARSRQPVPTRDRDAADRDSAPGM